MEWTKFPENPDVLNVKIVLATLWIRTTKVVPMKSFNKEKWETEKILENLEHLKVFY